MITTTRSVVLACLVLLSVGCASAPPPAAVASSSTINPRPGCIAASTEAVTSVTSTLIGDAKKIGQVFEIEENGRSYVGANIYDAGGKALSTADVWILEKGKAYALSSGARTNSNAADGRELPDKPSAGVGSSRFVAQCTQPT